MSERSVPVEIKKIFLMEPYFNLVIDEWEGFKCWTLDIIWSAPVFLKLHTGMVLSERNGRKNKQGD